MDRDAVVACLLTYKDSNVCIKQVPEKHGLGVFCLRALDVGVTIGDYQGEIMGSQVVRARNQADSGFRMEIGEDSGLYIDPIDSSGRTKYLCVCNYINEPSPSEKCNAAFFVDTINSRIYVRIVRKTKEGDEILVSYGQHFQRSYEVNIQECSKPWQYWEELLKANCQEPEHNSTTDTTTTEHTTQRNLDGMPKDTEDGEPVCVLCGIEATSDDGPIELHGVVRVHRRCALWSPEVFEDTQTHELMNVEKAVRRGRQIRCSRCDQRGATLGCLNTKCRKCYHFSCAQQEGCSFDHQQFHIGCADHRAMVLDSLPASKKFNPQNLGSKEDAWVSFRSAFEELNLDSKALKRMFLEQVRSTRMVKTVNVALQVEALCRTPECSGSWWPARVMGMSNGLALVRFDGYREDEDEWLPSCDVRKPAELVPSCGAVGVGMVVQVFSSNDDWRDAEVISVDTVSTCGGGVDCDICEVTVRYQPNSGMWAGQEETISQIPERISFIGQAPLFEGETSWEARLATERDRIEKFRAKRARGKLIKAAKTRTNENVKANNVNSVNNAKRPRQNRDNVMTVDLTDMDLPVRDSSSEAEMASNSDQSDHDDVAPKKQKCFEV